MHGCITAATDVTIAKAHFELYPKYNQGLLSVITGQYIETTFLFLGLSFTDPNFSHLFAEIKRSCGEIPPTHYAIIRKPKLTISPSDGEKKIKRKKQRYNDKMTEQNFWKKDLRTQYGIHCIEVEDWDELVTIIEKIGGCLPAPPKSLSAYQNKRVLVIDNPSVSGVDASEHLRAINLMFGGIQFEVANTLSDAEVQIMTFSPNVIVINPRICNFSEVVAWIDANAPKAEENVRRYVWGVMHDTFWSNEDDTILRKKSTRMSKFYSLEVTGEDEIDRAKIATFLDLCQVDFALNFLDDTVTTIINEFSGDVMTEINTTKFAEKAEASILRLNLKSI